MALFTLSYVGSDVYTLNPDGSVYKNLVGNPELYKNRIGEFKKIVLTYNTPIQSIGGLTLYFVPALFINASSPSPFTGGIPSSNYYSFDIDSVPTAGIYDMFLTGSVGYADALITNETVQLEVIDANNFTITITFYQIYDLNSYINPGLESNKDKLLKDLVTNAVLSVSGNNIYTNDKSKPKFYTFLGDPLDPFTKGSVTAITSSYRAGFYNKNELQTTPYFTDPQWYLNDGSDTFLSLTTNTKIDFWITAPLDVTKLDVWMIRTDTDDDTVSMRTNYEASFVNIPTNGATVQLDNKIYSPSQEPTFDAGVFKAFFHVDKTKLTAGAKYRFIAIAYYEDGYTSAYEVNSFISAEYSVSAPSFDGSGYTLSANLKDFDSQFDGNDLTCVIRERLKATVKIDYSSDAFKDDILNRLGLVVANDIRRYLTKITIQVYEDIGTTRQFYDRITINKQDPINYSNDSAITKNVGSDYFEIQYDFRVRYESGVPNIETQVANTILINPTSTQYWGGKNLMIGIDFELYYDDYVQPFSDIIKFIQKIHPTGNDGTLQILRDDDSTFDENTIFCSDVDNCFKAKLDIPDGDDYNLITEADSNPGNIANAEENEEWAGILPQLDSTKFVDQESEFGETETKVSKFCIASPNFSINSFSEITVIAKRIRNLSPPCARITEDGDLRITDSLEIRITETCP